MTKYLTKLTELDTQLHSSLVHEQIAEVKLIDAYVKSGQVIDKAPKMLGFLPDQFEEILEKIGSNKKKKLTVVNNLLNNFRQYLSLQYGIWSVPNLQTASLIKEALNVHSALEVMAGNAYWSEALSKVGVKTISTDSLEWAKTSSTGAKPFHQVIDLPADEAIKQYRNVDLVLCSWSPNFGTSDLETVNAWRKYNKNSHLLFIGEREGATNSPEFWSHSWFKKTAALAKINQSFRSFDFIDEQVFEIDEKL